MSSIFGEFHRMTSVEQMVSICRQQEADGLSVNGAWFEHFENVRSILS